MNLASSQYFGSVKPKASTASNPEAQPHSQAGHLLSAAHRGGSAVRGHCRTPHRSVSFYSKLFFFSRLLRRQGFHGGRRVSFAVLLPHSLISAPLSCTCARPDGRGARSWAKPSARRFLWLDGRYLGKGRMTRACLYLLRAVYFLLSSYFIVV